MTVSSSASFADANVGTGKTVTVSYNLGDGTNGGLASNHTLADSTIQPTSQPLPRTLSPTIVSIKLHDGLNSISVGRWQSFWIRGI